MNAWPTCGGSFAASTGAPMIAPRRAIGVPSAAVSVIDGGVGGFSDCDSGAVKASQPIAMTSSTTNAAAPRTTQRQMRRARSAGRMRGGGEGSGTGSCHASKAGRGWRGSPGA